MVTTETESGIDARTALDSGVISLVTPRPNWVYSGDGAGTLLTLRDGFAISHVVELNFAPEPWQRALFASGLVGLLGLRALRRKR